MKCLLTTFSHATSFNRRYKTFPKLIMLSCYFNIMPIIYDKFTMISKYGIHGYMEKTAVANDHSFQLETVIMCFDESGLTSVTL